MELRKEDLDRLWLTHSNQEIAKELETTAANVYRWARIHKMPDRRFHSPTLERGPDDPTTDEIAERAAAIRAAWTEQEHAARQVGAPRKPVQWEVPRFRFAATRGGFIAERATHE